MVRTVLHEERMGDPEAQKKKVGEKFAALRMPHLERLKPLEDMLRDKAPMPITYDVQRHSPPWFLEYTFTEMMGLILVSPQSCEVSARIVQDAFEHPADDRFDVANAVTQSDKYALGNVDQPTFKRVMFMPGSNISQVCVSTDFVDREMHEFPETVIKPHPMTHPNHLREMGIRYGYDRILEPMASGWAYLQGADVVYVPTSSEMGLHAVMMGKQIVNLTTFSFEPRGTFNTFYRLLWRASDPKAVLTHLLNSPTSGVFHPDDPNVGEKMDRFFAKSLELREPFRPLVQEYERSAYAWFVSQHQRPTGQK